MAHKKAGGSSRNGRDSKPNMLGVKRYGGEFVSAGTILVRQRGTPIHPGDNVGRGSDDTLFAKTTGHVRFERYRGGGRQVSIVPFVVEVVEEPAPVEDAPAEETSVETEVEVEAAVEA